MNIGEIDLMPAEYDALLETIRRDYRVESFKSQYASTERDWHCSNARMCIQLLELFNPKRQAVQTASGILFAVCNEPAFQNAFAGSSKQTL